MSVQNELGPISITFKRHLPFADNAGIKDRKGNPINLTYHKGRYLTPCQPEYFEFSRNAELRPDDIIVCGYAKTGCHLIWETLNMIRKGKGQYTELGKAAAYLEYAGPELYDNLPSPRILNTHNEFDWLPDKARTYKNKIILSTRNPKDVAVSLYNHHMNLPEMYSYQGEFPDWFELFLDGHVDNGDFFDYHLHWEQAIKENPDHPILVVTYEACREDFRGTIRKLSKFIETPLTEEQVEDIAESISFEAMQKRFEALPTKKLIRKGQVGDWKNWLTEEQSAELDRRSEKLKGTHFEPRFEL
ncbi:sulfotransferase family cytosolic 1b member 1 [Plakobranchus ocellatus]|uniref:Sulfotransferase family cytosolic 1b member 1 n=1 Tax=Plakobranchus ocellatus TaxID=259542 RepID=A0AAV3ZKK6_9GAST|nr:sulfotransferase family cytosolic 1b member 1 [Plakobranchus ocellatus]